MHGWRTSGWPWLWPALILAALLFLGYLSLHQQSDEVDQYEAECKG